MKTLTFQQARKKARWTATALAAELGVSRQTVVNYDATDWGGIRADTLATLTRLFNVRIIVERGRIVAESMVEY